MYLFGDCMLPGFEQLVNLYKCKKSITFVLNRTKYFLNILQMLERLNKFENCSVVVKYFKITVFIHSQNDAIGHSCRQTSIFVISLPTGYFFMLFYHLLFYFKIDSFRNTIRVPNSLDPECQA